jgi:hypothetical protein
MWPGHNRAKWIRKKAKQGFRGYPVGTLAFYGPDASRASKLVAAIVPGPDAEPAAMRKWFAEDRNIRADRDAMEEVSAFLREHGALSVTTVDGIIGCPHEEGIDYPEGEKCPRCPYWAHRDRWTGEIEH